MFLPVTQQSQPVLFSDSRKWTKIGEGEYYQSENVDGITLEIRHHENGKWRWWLYDDKSPDPDMAVTLEDADTIEQALAAAVGYIPSIRDEQGTPLYLNPLGSNQIPAATEGGVDDLDR